MHCNFMPSLSLNVGLNNGRKLPFGGGAAPSGIATATTTLVNIDMISSFGFEGNFAKSFPDSWLGPEGDYYLIFTGTRWEVTNVGDTIAFNESASQTVNYIPQTGWNISVIITVVL